MKEQFIILFGRQQAENAEPEKGDMIWEGMNITIPVKILIIFESSQFCISVVPQCGLCSVSSYVEIIFFTLVVNKKGLVETSLQFGRLLFERTSLIGDGFSSFLYNLVRKSTCKSIRH